MYNFSKSIVLIHSKALKRVSPLTWQNGFSSATIAEIKTVNSQNLHEAESKEQKQSQTMQTISKFDATRGINNKMVKRVFESLHLQETEDKIETPNTDNKLFSAKTVDELLSVSEGNGVSRRHALKVVSILSNWTTKGTVKLSEFENDKRFIKLCKILTGRIPFSEKVEHPTGNLSKSEDLSTVLSIAADDEAAKLVANITLQQMIKVLTTLSVRKRRSIVLLRTLSFNIAKSPEQMNIKECADLFFSIATLNFYDENLFEKAANNVIHLLETTKINKSSVVGSILTSVGLLRYKNPVLLDALSEWISNNHGICRPHDIFSLFMTLAILNHTPVNSAAIFKILVPTLTEREAGKPSVWLDIVWSLVLLNQANEGHFKSVLNDAFIDSIISTNKLNTSAILKLLNIDGAAHYLLPKYSGDKISKDHNIRNITLQLSKEKSEMVNAVVDAMKNLIPESYFKTRINTGLGFYIDAECILDKNCNPLVLNDTTKLEDGIKIAILIYDFHDVCKGKTDLIGTNAFCQRILNAMGYKLVTISHKDFKVTDKIVKKVQCLENQLKEAVKN